MSDDAANQGIPAPAGASDIIETGYEIGQDNIQTRIGPFGLDIHNPVFAISGLTIIAFVAYAMVAPQQAGDFFGWLRPALTSTFDWFFLSSANVFVLFCLLLIVTPYGSVRLGGSDSGSLVIDTITAGGKVDATVSQRVFWCTFEGLVVIALLLGGGLVSLRAMVMSTGLPFTVILLAICVTIWKGLASRSRNIPRSTGSAGRSLAPIAGMRSASAVSRSRCSGGAWRFSPRWRGSWRSGPSPIGRR